MTLVIEVYERDGTAAGTLLGEVEAGQWVSVECADVMNLRGAGTLVVPRLVGSDVNPALALLVAGNIIRLRVGEGDPFFAFMVEAVDDEVVSPREEAGELVTVKGREPVAVLLDKCRVPPDAGLGNLPWHPTRWFNFAADRLRDDDPDGPQGAWPFSFGQLPNYDTDNYFGRPEGLVDTAGPDGNGPEWLWDADTRTSFAAAGVAYFRQRFTLDADALVWFEFAADDEGELWVDDVPVCRVEGVYKGGAVVGSVQMEAGDHLIGAWGRNRNALRAGVVYAGWKVADGLPDSLVVRSDASLARCLAYPADPPGFTPTEVSRLVIDEHQTAGRLADLELSYISASDSASAAVSEVTDLTANAPGDSLLTFHQMLSETYLDFHADPDTLTLNAFIRGTLGSSTTVEFDKGTCARVGHSSDLAQRANTAWVTGDRFAPFEVAFGAPAEADKEIVSLDFGDLSRESAERFAWEYLAVASLLARGVTLEILPLPEGSTGWAQPYTDFVVGDTIGVLGPDGSVGDHRVAAIGLRVDAESVLRWSVELDQPSALLEERLGAIMRRQLPGGAGGRTLLPQMTQPSFPANQAGSEKSQTWSAPVTGTVVLTKNGTPITGASLSSTGRVTLTDAARKFTANSDEFDIEIDGVSGMDAPWKPTDGRWLMEMAVNFGADGVSITVRYV